MELWQEINTELTMMQRAIGELKARGQAKAETEYKYRMALSKRLIELKAEGNPVTHLGNIAKGEPEIAKLRLERDIADSLYNSCFEAINVYKIKIPVMENQLTREWGPTK